MKTHGFMNHTNTQCEICQRWFSNKSNATAHFKTTHADKSYHITPEAENTILEYLKLKKRTKRTNEQVEENYVIGTKRLLRSPKKTDSANKRTEKLYKNMNDKLSKTVHMSE